MSTSSQRPSSSSRDLTLVVESESGTPEEYFAQVALSIGRAKSNTIHINHPDVDHIHAKVVKRGEAFWLRCEGQAKLKVLDPEPGEVEEVELIPGLTIELGGTILRCRRQMRGMSSLSDDYWADAAGGERFKVETDSFNGELPKKIGPYEIRKFVARGGMGIVLRGIHQDTDQPAAVKLPTPDLNKDHQWLKRFEQEVRTLKSVTHPNLVRLQDAGREGELNWMAMDWVEGGTVANRIAKAKAAGDSIGLYEVQQILLQVVAGLNYLHSRNVVHRDLKPGNLLVGQDGHVKVADFGLAKQVGGEQSTVLTRTGTFAGTMHYMAPEQAEGMDITPATDVYALGVIWHELLTGKRPGGGRLKLQRFRSDCPADWESVMEDCLDRESSDRPNLADIKQALEAEVFEPEKDRTEEQTEEAQCKQKEEEQRRQREEAQRKQTDEAQRKQREEAQRKQREEAQRKQREEEERRQNKPPVVQRIIAPSPKPPVVEKNIKAEEEKPKSKPEPVAVVGGDNDGDTAEPESKETKSKIPLVLCGMVGLAILWALFGGGGSKEDRLARSQDAVIRAAAEHYDVAPALVKAVVWRESRFNADARGTSGELGLMQIRAAAAGEWAEAAGISDFHHAHLLNATSNTLCGAWYLNKLIDRYQHTDDPIAYALADYNAGRSNVLKWNTVAAETNSAAFIENIDFPTTKEYVKAVKAKFEEYQGQLE